MPIYAIATVLLIVLVGYLLYKSKKSRKERTVLLIESRLSDNVWNVFDSVIEAKVAIKEHQKKNIQSKDSFMYCMLKTTKYVLLDTGNRPMKYMKKSRNIK